MVKVDPCLYPDLTKLYNLHFTMLPVASYSAQVNRDNDNTQTVIFLSKTGYVWAMPFGVN